MIKNLNKVVQVGIWVLLNSLLSSIIPQVTQAQNLKSNEQINDITHVRDIVISQDTSIWLLGISKVQHLTAESNLIKQFGNGDTPLAIKRIAVAIDGSVWIINHSIPNKNSIQHYTVGGAFISQFGNGNYSDIKIAQDGSIWVVNNKNNKIQHFKANGSLIKEFGGRNSERGQFIHPRHIALVNDGSLWVTDGVELIRDPPWGYFTLPNNHRLQHFSAEGQFIKQFGTRGSGTTQFDKINDIAIADDGSIWIADGGNNRYYKHFEADGTFIERIKSIGLGSNSADTFSIAVSADGSIWTVSMSDTGSRHLRNLDTGGSIIKEFKTPSSCITEYDDLHEIVYLWNVEVDKQFYDAVLKFQKGHYKLVSSVLSSTHCELPNFRNNYPTLNPNLNNDLILSIPKVTIKGTQSHASFLYMGNNAFTLQSFHQYGE